MSTTGNMHYHVWVSIGGCLVIIVWLLNPQCDDVMLYFILIFCVYTLGCALSWKPFHGLFGDV